MIYSLFLSCNCLHLSISPSLHDWSSAISPRRQARDYSLTREMVIYCAGSAVNSAVVLISLLAMERGRWYKSHIPGLWGLMEIITGNALYSAAVLNPAQSFTFHLRNRTISIINSTAEIHPQQSPPLRSLHIFLHHRRAGNLWRFRPPPNLIMFQIIKSWFMFFFFFLLVRGIDRITGNLSTFSFELSTFVMAHFITKILLCIPVTTVNLSCLYMLFAAGKCQWVIDSELHLLGEETSAANAKKNRHNVQMHLHDFLFYRLIDAVVSESLLAAGSSPAGGGGFFCIVPKLMHLRWSLHLHKFTIHLNVENLPSSWMCFFFWLRDEAIGLARAV